jgi:hypothetical protein
VTIKPVTYRNPESQEDEPGAEVFLEGASEPLGWISPDHLHLVTSELSGVLISGGQYTLKVLCPLGEDNQGVRRSRPLGLKDVLRLTGDHLLPKVDYFPIRDRLRLSMEVVNGWQSKINQGTATTGDLDRWKNQAGSRAIIRPTTLVRAGVPEPAVAVYLDAQGEQFGWIGKEHIHAVKQEMHGYLARNGQYTLRFICA